MERNFSNLFEQMVEQGIYPSEDTYATIFSVCGIVKEAEKGISIHSHIVGSSLKVVMH